MSLLQETVALIKHLGQSTEDIIFIGSELSGHSCTWEEFCTLANFKYDNDSGSNEVPMDLIIVFFDMTKLFREECGGSEWWGIRMVGCSYPLQDARKQEAYPEAEGCQLFCIFGEEMRATRAKYLRRECKARFPSTTPVQLYGKDWWGRILPLTLTHAPGTFMPGTARRAP